MIRVLNEEFDKRTALHDAELYTQMAQLKMESSFQDFAASLDLLAHMIEERCGTRVPEAQLLSIIFNGLPQHADPLVSLLKQDSEMSYTKVKVRLQEYFDRLTFREGGDRDSLPNVQVFAAQARHGGKSGNFNSSRSQGQGCSVHGPQRQPHRP